MREQIAQWLSMSEKYGNFLVWDSLDNDTQENYRSRADRFIALLREEIEKCLLTDEDIFEVMYGTTWVEYKKQIGASDALCVESYIGDSDPDKIAQAQLRQILKALEV